MTVKSACRGAYFAARGVVLRFLFGRWEPVTIDPASVRSIAVIRIERLGDTVVSLPAIAALGRVFPQAKITVLAMPPVCNLLKNVPGISVISYEGFWKAAVTLRKGRFSLVVDPRMDYSLKPVLLAYLSGAPLRAGFAIEQRERFFNLSVAPSKEVKPMRSHMLDLARQIAKAAGNEDTVPDRDPGIGVDPEEKQAASRLLESSGAGPGQRLIGLHPGGFFPSQMWMKESFAELGRRLACRFQAKIIVIGSAKEKGLAGEIVGAIGKEAIAVIGLPLERLAAVISLMDVLVCNNSGPLHLAAALGVPTVSTMGPTDAVLWQPAGEKAAVICKDLPCISCGKGRCESHACMRSISVDEMEQAVALKIKG